MGGRLGKPAALEEALVHRTHAVQRNEFPGYIQKAALASMKLQQKFLITRFSIAWEHVYRWISREIQRLNADLGRRSSNPTQVFGRPRRLEAFTPAHGAFAPYRDAWVAIAASDDETDIFESYDWDPVHPPTAIPLTQWSDDWEHGAIVKHRIPTLESRAQIKRAFISAMRASSHGNVIQTVARFQWWMAHVMPFERGSAAANDIIAKAILLAKGVTLARWRAGVFFDFEAFCLNMADFVHWYRSFHEQ